MWGVIVGGNGSAMDGDAMYSVVGGGDIDDYGRTPCDWFANGEKCARLVAKVWVVHVIVDQRIRHHAIGRQMVFGARDWSSKCGWCTRLWI